MSGSGPIYEYQRELTAKLEQVMRERDEARACLAFERVTVAELRAEVARLAEAQAAAVEAFHDASRLRSEIQQARIKAEDERDEARADNADLLARLDAAAFAVPQGLREVAERQRELCKAEAYFYASLGWDADKLSEKVGSARLATEESE